MIWTEVSSRCKQPCGGTGLGQCTGPITSCCNQESILLMLPTASCCRNNTGPLPRGERAIPVARLADWLCQQQPETAIHPIDLSRMSCGFGLPRLIEKPRYIFIMDSNHREHWSVKWTPSPSWHNTGEENSTSTYSSIDLKGMECKNRSMLVDESRDLFTKKTEDHNLELNHHLTSYNRTFISINVYRAA